MEKIRVQDIIQSIEDFAPKMYQESYDNSGLLIGDAEKIVHKVFLCLDVTENVLDEAISNSCQMIVAHHPIIFSGLKKITGNNATEKIIIKAIRYQIAIFIAHTNLDNIRQGVNAKIAEKLNLKDKRVLRPSSQNLLKLYTYVPVASSERVKKALFAAGAGQIGEYSECAFTHIGQGSFKPSSKSNPAIGKAGGRKERVEEEKIEIIVPQHLRQAVTEALISAHPYEEAAYDWVRLENENQNIGAGMIGKLLHPINVETIFKKIQRDFGVKCIRHTQIHKPTVQKIAICGGSGSFLLSDAIQQKADLFISADFKYHQFFDAENKIIIADIGHFESEQFTVEIFSDIIKEKFPNFAVILSKTNTNPINYYI